jgi:hypothetical protein
MTIIINDEVGKNIITIEHVRKNIFRTTNEKGMYELYNGRKVRLIQTKTGEYVINGIFLNLSSQGSLLYELPTTDQRVLSIVEEDVIGYLRQNTTPPRQSRTSSS